MNPEGAGPASTGSVPPPSGQPGAPGQGFPYGDYPMSSPANGPMYAQVTPYAGSYQGGSYQGPNAPMSSPGSYPPPPPSGGMYLASAPPKAGLGAPSAPGSLPGGNGPEQTVQLGNLVSPELRNLAQLDVEETAAIDGHSASVLPPFLGNTKKA